MSSLRLFRARRAAVCPAGGVVVHRLAPPEARDAVPHPWLERSDVAVRVGSCRGTSRHMPRARARFHGATLPCG
eukprot:5701408-Alexandrium_andersonii.AAC.1